MISFAGAGDAKRRRAMGLKQKVYFLVPFERTGDWVKPWKASLNPLTMLTLNNKKIVEDAGLFADALVVPGGGDVHWDESAKNFIEGGILHVATPRLMRAAGISSRCAAW